MAQQADPQKELKSKLIPLAVVVILTMVVIR